MKCKIKKIVKKNKYRFGTFGPIVAGVLDDTSHADQMLLHILGRVDGDFGHVLKRSNERLFIYSSGYRTFKKQKVFN